MKIRAYNKETEPEKEVYLRLVNTNEGGVNIVVAAPDGSTPPGGLIAEISGKGLYLYKGMLNAFDFPLDSQGRIKVITD